MIPEQTIIEDLATIMNTSIDNLKKASAFIEKITKGEYDVTWPGMNAQNAALNQQNLSGTLIDMRDQMKRIKEEDENRIWITEGLDKVHRNHSSISGKCKCTV